LLNWELLAESQQFPIQRPSLQPARSPTFSLTPQSKDRVPVKPKITFAEYLAYDDGMDIRYELVDEPPRWMTIVDRKSTDADRHRESLG
jgi:hypothetical protein